MKLYKHILQHSGIYTISVVFSKLVSILMLPLYTRYLTPADYGIMELVELVSYVFTVLIGIHFADAVFYFYSAAEDDDG